MGVPKDLNARKYYRVAKQRLEEAELILTKLQLPAAAQYLAGYGVECILKTLPLVTTPERQRPAMADLIKRDDKKENRFGHNLRGLRAGLTKRGVSFPREVISGLTFVLTWSPDARYEPGLGSFSDATQFLKAVRSVVIWADGRM